MEGDQVPQAVGEYMNQKGVKSAFLIAPNYAAGKDVIAGLKANYKGAVVGEEYTAGPTSSIFPLTEQGPRRKTRRDLCVYPGGAGVQLSINMPAGLKQQIPLYTAFIVDACRCHSSRTSRSVSQARSIG